MKKMMLGKALRKRSTRAELVDQGIFKEQSSQQMQMEQNMNKVKLGNALRKRSTRAELSAQGILIEQTGKQLEAERNMNKSMLNRRFSQRPAVDQLATLGIYREDDSERLQLERQLISSQLNKALSRRMSRQEQGNVHGHGHDVDVMDEDVLAVVFQRLAGKTELLSLEKIRAWEEVQNQLRNKKLSEGELLKVFHETDSDKDGSITFFEFLLFLRALEERQKAKAKPARRKSLMSIKRKGSLLENATSVGRNESLKGVLLKKMRARPEVQQLHAQGIYRAHNASPAASLLERNLMTNKLKASLSRRQSRDQLVAQGILKEQSSQQVEMQQNMQKAMLGRRLSNRPERSQLESQGIFKEQSARQASMEKNMAKSMLSRKLSNRPDKQQLENIGVYQKASSANIALERSLIASQLTRALRRRPSRELLEGKGILEEDEFAIMFRTISNSDELLSLEDLQSWDIVAEQIETGGLAADVLPKVFGEVDGDNDGMINFSQFLTVLELTDILQKQNDEHQEDSPAEKLRKRRMFRQKQKRDKDKGEGELIKESSLKSALLQKMRLRPEMQQLTASGILKEGRSPAAQLLERNLIAANLQRGLQSRRTEGDLKQLGIMKTNSAQQTVLELGMNKAMLGKALSRRSSKAELTALGIYRDASSSAVDLERNMQKALLGRKLSHRPDKEQLQNLGIYRQETATAMKLNAGLIQRKLSLSLDSRPEKDALMAQGILKDATSKSVELERNMQKALLGRRLSNRPDKEQLQNLGIYKQGHDKSAGLQRNLLGSQLNRKLSTRTQLDELQKLGIYKETTSQAGALERSLIENQLNRALGRRKSRADVEAAGILKKIDSATLEADKQTITAQLNQALGRRQTHADLKLSGIIPDVLAVAFKEICGETECAKLEQLKDMKGLKDMLQEGGISEEKLVTIFEEVDTDKDGEINFSQFLSLTERIEVEGQRRTQIRWTESQKNARRKTAPLVPYCLAKSKQGLP
jgi:Ca2+-binding EF-hand superfamily protein